MILSIAILVLQIVTKFSNLYSITITLALFFGIMVAIASFLLQREINRRL